jgi:dihydrolipoamide dehydrogenase
MAQFDFIVIGGGPAGYTGAIRAAQLGLKTAIIEKDKTLGGTCLNVGCIPSKALLESSEHYAAALHDLDGHGIKVDGVQLQLDQLLARKDKVVKDLTGGVASLMKKNKIEVFQGTGRFKDATHVEVNLSSGGSTILEGKQIMIATGSVPVELPGLKFDSKHVVSSTEALAFQKVPKHLIVVGAGAIGLEMGSVWSRLGAKVTVVEYGSKICGTMDDTMSTELFKVLKKQGLEFLLDCKVLDVKVDSANKDGAVTLRYDQMGAAPKPNQTLTGDVVLVSAGRRAYAEGLGLDTLGIQMDKRGRILVDEHLRTSISNIFAVGDVVDGPMLAHKAEEEGVAAAETAAGLKGHVNYETVPSVIYTWPEVASVGLTEEQVKAKGWPYRVGKFPFLANGRAKALGNTNGTVKIIAHDTTNRILGVHIMGPRASDMIAEAVIAIEFGSTAEQLGRSFHAHPTLSETVREAALAVDKRARQI